MTQSKCSCSYYLPPGTYFKEWILRKKRKILHAKNYLGTSLVVQWLRIDLPMQETWVRSLVREDPTCLGATKPMNHNCWSLCSATGEAITISPHTTRLWCWERLKAGGEGDDRRWDGWVASPTQWTWVWASSGRWWRTGKPGVLQSMGSQRARHDWATEKQQKLENSPHSPQLKKTRA